MAGSDIAHIWTWKWSDRQRNVTFPAWPRVTSLAWLWEWSKRQQTLTFSAWPWVTSLAWPWRWSERHQNGTLPLRFDWEWSYEYQTNVSLFWYDWEWTDEYETTLFWYGWEWNWYPLVLTLLPRVHWTLVPIWLILLSFMPMLRYLLGLERKFSRLNFRENFHENQLRNFTILLEKRYEK